MTSKILIANRGEIACRIARTARRLGIPSVAVFSSADRNALHRFACDEAYMLGAGESHDSYLNIDKILHIAEISGATLIHPGYGFLSENALFAQAVRESGKIFIGPSPETIELAGSKTRSKEVAEQAGVPLLKTLLLEKKADIQGFIKQNGFPLLVKAAAGGGGRGMRIVQNEGELESALESASREALAFFNDERVFIEPYIAKARHVEIQILGDNHGTLLALAERDCTLQRNHQKVLEEAPAPALSDKARKQLRDSALKVAEATKYTNAGTVEFLVTENEDIYFLEVNSRLQVEHPVTEDLFQVDLVELQIAVAENKRLIDFPGCNPPVEQKKHFLEARICAESPEENYAASTGRIIDFAFPEADFIRLDTGYTRGKSVTHYYDSLLAKLIVSGESRETAIRNLIYALENSHIAGVKTNIAYLLKLLKTDEFASMKHSTTFAGQEKFRSTYLHNPHQVLALAMLALHLPEENAVEKTTASFRLSGQAYKSHDLILGNEVSSVKITFQSGDKFCSASVQRPGETREFVFEDTIRDDCYFQTTCSGKTISFYASTGPDAKLWLSLHGRSHLISTVAQGGANKGDATSNAQGDTLHSSLPGKVLEVHCQAGDTITEGDLLLKIESMKMEHPIHAERSGVIAEVAVKEQDIVEAEALLVTFAAEKS